ncbi:MAG: type II toxin-antitoxin system RelE/ParE family toxin [Candidatus Nanoarchaeia archaeon]|nr:type II toxin-antitoxin system RelE/ParE family toxin [Candidatus Nanoarchaeia archaeon]
MLIVEYKKDFLNEIKKIKDTGFKEKVKKHIEKILENPEIGKPMMYTRKGTREVYISPYRLAYSYLPSENKLIFLELYHKDKQ